MPGATILRDARGPTYERRTHYPRVYAAQLRRKLEDDPSRARRLVTISGIRYTLEP